MSMFEAGLVLSLNDKLSGPLAAVERRYNQFGRGALQNAARVDQAGRQMMRAGVQTAAVGVAMAAPFALAGRAYAGFDSAMTRSTSIMGDLTDAQSAQLRATALQTAGAFKAEQLGEAYYFLASAGLSAEQQVGALGTVSKFATAGAFDLALATDLLTDAQSALGLTTDDAVQNQLNMARVADVVIRANTLANASAEQFSTAITNGVGAAARAAGKDVEEATGALAVLADQGLKGAAAGTALTGVLQMLPKTAIQNAAAFARYGVEVFDAEGNMRSLADITDSMTEAFEGMSDAERAAAFDDMKLNRQLGDTVTQLLGTGDAMREYEAALRDAGGATDEVAAKQAKGLIPTLTRVKNRLSVLGISIIQDYSGPLAAAATRTEAFVNRIIAWTQAHPRLTSALVATAAATSALLVVGGGGLVLFGALARGAAAAARAVIFLRSATGVLGAHFRIAARRARLFALSQGTVSASSIAGAGALKSFAVGARAAVTALATNPLAWGLVAGAFLVWKFWKPIKAFFGGLFEGFAEGFRPALAAFEGVAEAARPLVDAVSGFLGAVFRQADPAASTLLSVASAGRTVGRVLGFIVGGAATMLAAKVRVLTALFGAVPAVLRLLWSTVRLAFSVSPLGLFLSTARGVFRAVRTLVTGGGWREAGRQLIMSIVAGIRSAAGALVQSVGAVFSRLRRMVPGSPVKDGPLRSFNTAGRGLMELAASTVTPRPIQRAVSSAFSAVQTPALAASLAVSPTGGLVGSFGADGSPAVQAAQGPPAPDLARAVAPPATPASVSAPGVPPIVIRDERTVNVHLSGAATAADVREGVGQALAIDQIEFERMLARALDTRTRL